MLVEQYVELCSEQLAVSFLEMPLQLRLVWQHPVQATVQPRVVDLAFFDSQQIIQSRGRVPALFNRQLTAWRAQPVDRQHRGNPRPGHISLMLVDGLFEEAIQFQTLPKFQTEPDGSELPRPLQTHLVQQHPRHLRIIRRRFHLRREQLQLLRFTLLVENFNRLQPARLRGTVQLAEVAQCFLTRTIGRAHRFHQRPIGVVLTVLASPVRAQKHSQPILS